MSTVKQVSLWLFCYLHIKISILVDFDKMERVCEVRHGLELRQSPVTWLVCRI